MPPKRKSASSDYDSDSDVKPRKKAVTKKPAAPRLKKAKQPNWEDNPKWSAEKPEGKYARMCVEKWLLQPPYNTSIKEEDWKKYYQERTALDEINTEGSDHSKPIISEELGQDTFKILRRAAFAVASTIYGSALLDDDEKKRIARTLLGSLYFTELWGNDEEGGGDNPRTVNAKTRLYSPFGLGTSLDLAYNFHWRQFRAGERFSDFIVHGRDAEDCNPKKPTFCSAVTQNKNGRTVPAEFSVKVFDMNNSKIKGTTATNITDYESHFFGSDGWLSPLKIFNLLCAAGTVLHYKENNGGTVKKAGGEKFKFFQSENDGREMAKEEVKVLQQLEKESPVEGDVCLPQRLLLLAKSEGENGAGTEAE